MSGLKVFEWRYKSDIVLMPSPEYLQDLADSLKERYGVNVRIQFRYSKELEDTYYLEAYIEESKELLTILTVIVSVLTIILTMVEIYNEIAEGHTVKFCEETYEHLIKIRDNIDNEDFREFVGNFRKSCPEYERFINDIVKDLRRRKIEETIKHNLKNSGSKIFGAIVAFGSLKVFKQ